MSVKIKILQLVTPHIDGFAVFSVRSIIHYAKRYGYSYSIFRDKLIEDMHINWTKIEMMRIAFDDPTYDYLVLFDADMLILPTAKRIEALPGFGQYDLIMPQDTPLFTSNKPNAGCIIVRNSSLGKEIFEKWIRIARNEGSYLADIHPRNQRIFWKYLLPKYRGKLKLMNRSLFPKFHFFTPWINYSAIAYHFSQSDFNDRENQMRGQFLKNYPQDDYDTVITFLNENQAGTIDASELDLQK
ncbi:MAG: hypothetical protein ACO2ZZ_12335 [Cyclobacteriaceae bacterium]